MGAQRVVTHAELQQRLASMPPVAQVPVGSEAFGPVSTHSGTQPTQQPAPEQQPNDAMIGGFSGEEVQAIPERNRHRRAWVALGSLAVIAACGIAYDLAPGFPGNGTHTANSQRLHTGSESSQMKSLKPAPIKPSKSAVVLPAAVAAFTPGPIGCTTIDTVAVNEDVPMFQSEQLKGDPTRYNFGPGPTADFVAQVSGSVGIIACFNNTADKVQLDTQAQNPPGTKTYTFKLGTAAVTDDTTKLQVVPTWREPQAVLHDVCGADGGVFDKNGKVDQAKSPSPLPESCAEYSAYKPGHSTEYLNEIQAGLTKEAPNVAEATTALVLGQIDTQLGGNLTQSFENYLRNGLDSEDVTQAKSQQAKDSTHKYSAPNLNFNFSGTFPLFGKTYLANNKGVSQELDSGLQTSLEQQIEAYQKANPGDKKLQAALAAKPLSQMSLTDLLTCEATYIPGAKLPPFGIDDNASDYTPSLVLQK